MKYYGILKKRAPWLKIAIVVAALYMLYLSVTGKQITYAALTIVVIIAVFFEKEHIISEEGIDIKYTLFGMHHVNRWEWSDITALKTDYKKSAPNVRLHINKDVTIRDFIFVRSEITDILNFAREMNPDIYIDDSDRRKR